MERKVCTIGEWLDVWYEVYAVPEYAPKTLEIYRDARKRLSRKSKAHCSQSCCRSRFKKP